MAHAVIKIWLFLLFDFSVTEAALTPEIVFDVLSRRMDYVIQETYALKSELEEVKSDFKSELRAVVGKIENVESSLSAFTRNQGNIEDEMEESDVNDNMKRQLVTFRKTVSAEKYHLRKMVKRFENKFNAFETEIKSQMALIKVSEENSVDGIFKAMAQHKVETNTSLMLISSRIEAIANGTDTQIEDMKQDIEDSNTDSLEKINEMKQEILDRSKSDLKRAKDGVNDRIYTEIGKLKSKIASIEGKQEYQEDSFDDRLIQLSKRISEEEARKIAFSSQQTEYDGPHGPSEKVVFDKVIYSYGGGYNSSTGVFTAPKSEDQKDKFDDQINQLSNRISEEEARKVAFSAQLREGRSNFVAEEKVVFDHVMYSYGEGYNSSTGVFTAPKAGTYLFTINVGSFDGRIVHVVLMTGGHAGIYLTGGKVGIVYLSYGDTAWIQTGQYHDKHYMYPYKTTFNGILID